MEERCDLLREGEVKVKIVNGDGKIPREANSTDKRKWVTLAILFTVNLLNYMDRYTYAAILDPFSKEMCLSMGKERCTSADEGFVQTLFMVFYLVCAPLFGYLGDRYSRKYTMVVGVLLWASLSLAASFMTSFWPFAVVRGLIAVGESAFTIIAPTVIGDLFTDNERSLMLGVFYIAIPVGTGLGFGVGGAPGPENWRWGLRITPWLTFLSAIIMLFFLYDPPRGEAEGAAKSLSPVPKSTYWQDLRYIAGVKSFVLNAAGFTFVTFTTGALAFFGPVYMENGIKSIETCTGDPSYVPGYVSPISVHQVTLFFGILACLGGLFGVVSGMFLSKHLRPRFQWVDPVICGASLLASVPFLLAGIYLTKDSLVTAFVIILLGMVLLNFNWSVAVDMTIYVITPSRRSTAEAIHLMLTHALGEALAPWLVGMLADHLEDSIKENNPEYCEETVYYYSHLYAFLLPFVLLFIGGVLFLFSTIWVVNDKRKVDEPSNVNMVVNR